MSNVLHCASKNWISPRVVFTPCKSSGVMEERSLFFFLFINIFITTASIAVGVEVSRIGDMRDKDHQGAAITMVLFVLMNLSF